MKSLEWAFSPIIQWMRIIGIPLYSYGERSKFKSWLSTGLSLVNFFLNTAITWTIITVVIQSVTLDKTRKELVIVTSNDRYDRLNLAFITFGSHFALLALTAVKWPAFMKAFYCILLTMENRKRSKVILASNDYYTKIRKIFLSGLAVILLLMLSIACFNLIPFWLLTNHSTLHKATFIFSHLGMITYAFSSITLFACLTQSVEGLIRILSDKVCCLKTDSSNGNSPYRNHREYKLRNNLETWKSQYLLMQRLIEKLNGVFGCVLLIVVSSTFLRLLNNSYKMLVVRRYYSWHEMVFIYSMIVQDAAMLIMLSFVSHRLKNEVKCFARLLQSMSFKDNSTQVRVDSLVVQILQDLPNITAMGFFKVDFHLLPKIMAIILSFLPFFSNLSILN